MEINHGQLVIGRYNFWITSAPSCVRGEYYHVIVTRRGLLENDYLYFHSLHKNPEFPFLDYRFPPKELKVKKKKKGDASEDDVEIVPETEQEAIYREEYRWYANYKEMCYGDNEYVFHKSTLEKILTRCQELTLA